MSIVPQRLYNEVMMVDDFTCVYCGRRNVDMTVDHFVPRSQGGPDVLANLMTACAECNRRKWDLPAHEARMAPRYGRFSRAVSSRSLRVKPSAPLTLPHIDRIAALAREQADDGKYRYSANTIVKIVGGSRNAVLAEIAAIRNPEKVSVAHRPGAPLKRPVNGW